MNPFEMVQEIHAAGTDIAHLLGRMSKLSDARDRQAATEAIERWARLWYKEGAANLPSAQQPAGQ